MPRNRREIDRHHKMDEILAIAERVLRAEGYQALSLSAIARELGLARAAIYWYFPTRDDLFVAAVGRIFTSTLSHPQAGANDLLRIHWAVDRLAELQPLHLALHQRARHSPAAARLQAAIEEDLCQRLRHLLASHIEQERLEQTAQAIVVFVNGLLTPPRPPAERHDLLTFLITQLLQPPR